MELTKEPKNKASVRKVSCILLKSMLDGAELQASSGQANTQPVHGWRQNDIR